MIKKELGQEIRKLRTARGFTQETFSKACGLDRTYIADVELGKRNISIENIDKIAKGLQITLPELFKFNSPIQKTIILNINGEQFILESDTELTMDKKNYIEAICETMYDESNEWWIVPEKVDTKNKKSTLICTPLPSQMVKAYC